MSPPTIVPFAPTHPIIRDMSEHTNLPYTPTRILGHGQYGVVLSATHQRTGDQVAIKVSNANDPDKVNGVPRSFSREVAILKHSNHENVMKSLNMFASEHFCYILMPLATCSLRDIAAKESYRKRSVGDDAFIPMKTSKVMMYMKQILQGLEYLHVHKIMHRDIKPDNILIQDGVIKLADFGISRLEALGEEETCYTGTVVTSWYRPPEIMLGSVDYTNRVDIWSAALVGIELIFGDPFFPCKSEWECLMMIMADTGKPTDESWPGVSDLPNYTDLFPNFVPQDRIGSLGLPTWAYIIFRSMLTQDPEQRPSATQAMMMWPVERAHSAVAGKKTKRKRD